MKTLLLCFALLGGNLALIYTYPVMGDNALLAQTKAPKRARMSPSLIKKLETIKNRKFSDAEKEKLHAATQKMQNALQPSHEKFIQEVAKISLVPIARVRESVMKPGQAGSINTLIIKLNTIGGRAINNTQRSQLEVADRQRKKAILAVREQYAKEVAQITGLTAEQVLSQLPKVGL